MVLLLGFALLAGAGTALSPCVLPVLPALLSAGGVGGRRRPFGIVLGLAVTFTVTIVGLSTVVDGVGLGDDPLRDVAVVVLKQLQFDDTGRADPKYLQPVVDMIAKYGKTPAFNAADLIWSR